MAERHPRLPVSRWLAAASSLLAAGADLSDRPELRRVARIGALAAGAAGTVALIHDLGQAGRFLNMMRTVKPTSPMSVGTWILAAFRPMAGLAGAAEVAALLPFRVPIASRLLDLGAGRPGLLAAAVAPGLASYTGVLLTDTATPGWHAAQRELPLIFVASAAAAAGGLGMAGAPVEQATPARRMAVGGAALALVMEQRMERSMGLSAETLHAGKARRSSRRAGRSQSVAHSARSSWDAATALLRPCAGRRCSPARRSCASPSSRRARRPHEIRATRSSRSESAFAPRRQQPRSAACAGHRQPVR